MLRISIACLLLLSSTFTGADDSLRSDCTTGGFQNNYYLIDVTDVREVSRFFREVPGNYFEAMPGFSNLGGRQRGTTRYFDFKDPILLNAGKELYLSVLENLPSYRLDRQRVLYRNNSIAPTASQHFEVKQYNRRATAMDRHELFGQIRRKDRPALTAILATISDTPPITLKDNLTVSHQEIVYLTTHYGKAHAAISLRQFHIANFGMPNTHTLLKFELFSDQLQDLTDAEQTSLTGLYCRVHDAFKTRFPHIRAKNWFGYADYHQLAIASLPSNPYLQRYPLLYSIGQIITLCTIGFLVLYLLLGRYSKRANSRILTKTRPQHREP